MRNVTLKGLLAHKLRLALTALAIVLGVTFISGTFVLTDTLHNTFSVLFGSVYQQDRLPGPRGGRSSAAAARTRSATSCPSRCWPPSAVPGVAAAEGEVEGYAQFVARDGKPIQTGGAPALGVNFDPTSSCPACTSSRAARR
jgi:putative ABC transport system permease protein